MVYLLLTEFRHDKWKVLQFQSSRLSNFSNVSNPDYVIGLSVHVCY